MPTYTQITRRKNADTTEQLIRKSDGLTLAYSGTNLTTMLSGVSDPLFVLKRIGINGISYPFTLQARNQTEFTTADFETVWNILIANPDRTFKL